MRRIEGTPTCEIKTAQVYPSEQLDRLMQEYEMWLVPDEKELTRYKQHGLSAFELGEMHRHYLIRSVDANSLSAFLDLTSISLPSEFPMQFSTPLHYWKRGSFELGGNPRLIVAGINVKNENLPNRGINIYSDRGFSSPRFFLENDLAGIGIKLELHETACSRNVRMKAQPVYLKK